MAIWDNFTNQKQWELYLKNLIKTNQKALLKSIVVIYDNQTDEEKENRSSIEKNRIGFDMFDAEEMMGIAEKIKKNIPLMPNEIVHAKIVMPKYWRQLMVISKMKIKEREEHDRIQAEVQNINKDKENLQEEINENVRKCTEEGKACSYGICDECPMMGRNS